MRILFECHQCHKVCVRASLHWTTHKDNLIAFSGNMKQLIDFPDHYLMLAHRCRIWYSLLILSFIHLSTNSFKGEVGTRIHDNAIAILSSYWECKPWKYWLNIYYFGDFSSLAHFSSLATVYCVFSKARKKNIWMKWTEKNNTNLFLTIKHFDWQFNGGIQKKNVVKPLSHLPIAIVWT